MQILLYIIVGISLIICTITDLKYKEIYLPVIIAGSVLVLCFHIWQQSISFADVAGAVIVCLLFVISSVVTRGQLGMGDAFLFALTGLGTGIMANIFIIIFSFMLAFCAAVFLVLVKHKQHNYCMPLAPFVLGSFIFYVAGIYIPL
ncbi:MAG: prepilin peptidase [Lachnospiraceae bacterium]|nr:prepilin peptidase [Lachnospiraceae bacterium]